MSELHNTLQALHDELHRAERLEPDDRALLETLAADIGRLLVTAKAAPGTGQSATVSRQDDALESAAVRLEAGHPGVAGAIRAVLDALGKAGI